MFLSLALERFVNEKLIKAAKVVLDMAQRGIREYDAKRLLARILPEYLKDFSYRGSLALVEPETDLEELEAREPWMNPFADACRPRFQLHRTLR